MERPPTMVAVAEAHIRRHELAGWPRHAVEGDFYREPAEQEAISASFAPVLEREVRLVLPWLDSTTDAIDWVRAVSADAGRPGLAHLPAHLLNEARWQRIEGGASRAPPVPEQVAKI